MGVFLFTMAACDNNKEATIDSEVKTEEKKSEMTENQVIIYLYEVTYRLREANREENGSFEQRSVLQAAVGRSESITEEIEEKFEKDLPIALAIIELAEYNKRAAEKALEGDYDSIINGLLTSEALLIDFAEEYLGGEVPAHLQYIELLIYKHPK